MKWIYTLGLLLSFTFFGIRVNAQVLSCDYTLELFDTFGDGWNGAFITILINGVPQEYTLNNFDDDGSFNSFLISVSDGDEIEFFFDGGTFDNEITYNFFSPEGVLLLSEGPNPTLGLIFSGNLVCPSCLAPAPALVSVDDVRAFTAELSWILTDPEGVYYIEYDTTGFDQGTGTEVSTTGDDITLVNLQENTTYQFYITAVCANGDTSNVVGPFEFTTLWAVNVGISNISMPESDCGLGVMDAIEVTIANFGGNPQSLIPFNYSVNGLPGGVNQPIDGFYTGVLGKDSTVIIEFEATFDFSEPGEYVIQAWTELEGDSVITNDTTTITIVSIPTVTEYPYFIDFEEWSGGWRVDEESTNPSWEFGMPAGAFLNSAASGENAWVTNLDGDYNTNEFSFLVSPCLDFSGLTEDPRLTFSLYFDSESCCDEAWVEQSIDGGETWTKVGTAGTGINWYNDTGNDWWDGDAGFDGWVSALNTLEGTAGESDVLIRFVMSTDFSVQEEGIGIDDVFIAPPLTNDLAAITAANTSEIDCGEENDMVTVTISNFGTAVQTSFDVFYSVNGDPAIMETITGITLNPNEEISYTFDQTFDSSEPGTYTIQAWSSLGTDQFIANDTTTFSFTTTASIPFVENFEGMVLPEGWTADGTVNDDHNNVSFALYDNLWSADQTFTVETPAIGLIAADDSLTFDYRFVDFSGGGTNATVLGAGDSLTIAISTDCGETYTDVFSITSENHTSSNVMTNQTVQLGAFEGESIKIRFLGVWATGDYWLDLDNINIIRCPASLGLSAEIVNESVTDAADGIASIATSAGLEPFTYFWNTGDSTKTVTGLTAGIYDVIVTDAAGCSDIIEVVIETVVGVEQIDNITALDLAPNPTNGTSILNVSFSELVDARVRVVNMVGQQLLEQRSNNIREASYEIDLNAHPAGLYFVQIIVDNQIHTEKLVHTGGN